jgi:hypothetical protein
MYRRVLYTFADVPLNAGRLVVSQVTSTTLQEDQGQSQERGFDDDEHARNPLFIGSSAFPPAPRKPYDAGENGANSGPVRSAARPSGLTVAYSMKNPTSCLETAAISV